MIVGGPFVYGYSVRGMKSGVDTALVLTGEATREEGEACEYGPDYIFSSVEELYQEWSGEMPLPTGLARICNLKFPHGRGRVIGIRPGNAPASPGIVGVKGPHAYPERSLFQKKAGQDRDAEALLYHF